MLTKMSTEGSDYNEVLKDAQAKGYAEADPTADVEGYDACRKIAILTSLVCGKTVDFEEIHTEGISKITPEDIAYAKAMGRSIKMCIRDSLPDQWRKRIRLSEIRKRSAQTGTHFAV